MQSKILPNGNLQIKADAEDVIEDFTRGCDIHTDIAECLDKAGLIGNGYHLIAPETIGALTDSTIIMGPNVEIWWSPGYCVVNEVEEIFSEDGFEFTYHCTLDQDEYEKALGIDLEVA